MSSEEEEEEEEGEEEDSESEEKTQAGDGTGEHIVVVARIRPASCKFSDTLSDYGEGCGVVWCGGGCTNVGWYDRVGGKCGGEHFEYGLKEPIRVDKGR